MKALFLCVLVLVGGTVFYDILSSAEMETEYEELHLLVEAMWYKVPAMDVIEASVSIKDIKEEVNVTPCLDLEFYLQYPDGETTDIANIPEGECLGEVDTVSVKFYIWCHDFGGWSVFVFSDGVFEFIGRTRLDFPVGDWAVIVVDRETKDTVAELPLYVAISKPTQVAERLSKGTYGDDVF